MKSNLPKFHSLSRRIVLQFCGFTVALSLVYGFVSFVLMYTLEDSFIERDIQREATYLRTEFKQTGNWPAPRKSTMQLHFSKATFPEDMREKALEEPRRSEFYGQDGRHYHLYTFKEYQGVYLLAEVSGQLLVRPIRGGVITFLSISALIVTIIACLIAWLIGRKTARPLKQLAELVDGVAPEHVPSQFAHAFPNNEVGILARALEQSFQRLAQALEREKCFTRDVSHELRTPLAVVKNGIELLRSKPAANNAGSDVLNRLAESAEQMEKTVYTLLMLAREEHAHSQKEQTNLMPVIERSVLDNSALLEGKQVEIEISDNCNTQVCAQVGMLKVLLDNLLDRKSVV